MINLDYRLNIKEKNQQNLKVRNKKIIYSGRAYKQIRNMGLGFQRNNILKSEKQLTEFNQLVKDTEKLVKVSWGPAYQRLEMKKDNIEDEINATIEKAETKKSPKDIKNMENKIKKLDKKIKEIKDTQKKITEATDSCSENQKLEMKKEKIQEEIKIQIDRAEATENIQEMQKIENKIKELDKKLEAPEFKLNLIKQKLDQTKQEFLSGNQETNEKLKNIVDQYMTEIKTWEVKLFKCSMEDLQDSFSSESDTDVYMSLIYLTARTDRLIEHITAKYKS